MPYKDSVIAKEIMKKINKTGRILFFYDNIGENRRHPLCRTHNLPLEEGQKTIYIEGTDDY